MARNQPQPEADREEVLECVQQNCPHCNKRMRNKYDNYRTVRTLAGVIRLRLKIRRCYNSGKKKRHTLKAQVVVDQRTGKIICTAYGTGRKHDFHLFKDSQVAFAHSQICLADSGYQGIVKLHSLSCTPSKKPCNTHLPESHRQYNRLLACWRVVAEHTNRRLKIFRILVERYRNRRKRFGLRFNLIAGLLNVRTFSCFLIHARGLIKVIRLLQIECLLA